jgi:hypothetical protein
LEYNVIGGGTTIWADGAQSADCLLLEAKYVGNPANSPYVPGSSAPSFVQANVNAEVSSEMIRYANAINDPNVPAVGLQVITSNALAAPYFQTYIAASGVPNGNVSVLP